MTDKPKLEHPCFAGNLIEECRNEACLIRMCSPHWQACIHGNRSPHLTAYRAEVKDLDAVEMHAAHDKAQGTVTESPQNGTVFEKEIKPVREDGQDICSGVDCPQYETCTQSDEGDDCIPAQLQDALADLEAARAEIAALREGTSRLNECREQAERKLARVVEVVNEWNNTEWNGTESAQFKGTIMRACLDEISASVKDAGEVGK